MARPVGLAAGFSRHAQVQLAGRKRWLLCAGPVAHPLRGHTPHYAMPPDAVLNQLKAHRLAAPDFPFAPPARLREPPESQFPGVHEVVLEAGDVLYFPAGMWHRVETLDPGPSLNVSCD